jgi:hypothetical protein
MQPEPVYFANLLCLILAPLTFWVWQKRNDAKIRSQTYCIGIIVSYYLFLIFSFLYNFVFFTYQPNALIIPIEGIIFMMVSGVFLALYFNLGTFYLSKKVSILIIFNFVWSTAWSSLLLLFPLVPLLADNPWILTVLPWVGASGSIALVLALIAGNLILARRVKDLKKCTPVKVDSH